MSMMRRAYSMQIDLMTRVQPVLLLAIRLYWGWQFFLTGRGKLMNLERTAAFFDSLGIPLPMLNAGMAGTTECLGGLLMLAGLGSRMTTIPLVATMLVAYATAHQAELGALFNNPDAFVSAPPFLFLLASLMVMIFGPGWISADGMLQHFCFGKCPLNSSRPAAPSATSDMHTQPVVASHR